MLENTPREFGGVGWPGCGVVNIVLVGSRSAAAHRKKKIGRAGQESVNDKGVLTGPNLTPEIHNFYASAAVGWHICLRERKSVPTMC